MTEAAMGMGVVAATAQAADVRDQLNTLSSSDALKTLLTLFTPASTQTAADTPAQSTPASTQPSAESVTEITPPSTPAEDAKSVFSSLFDRLTNPNGNQDDSSS
jgi:hypothetical protein